MNPASDPGGNSDEGNPLDPIQFLEQNASS
jgi:hypothetical protein